MANTAPHHPTALPLLPPPTTLPQGPTRDLLSLLCQHDWHTYPATQGQAEVVSPDHLRSLVLRLVSTVDADGEQFRLAPYIEGSRIDMDTATRYIRGEA